MVQMFDFGARWLRCDLHVHTPFDAEKKFGEDLKAAIQSFRDSDPLRLEAIAERVIQACREAADGEGMDVIALTDHNSVDGYRFLSPYFGCVDERSTPVILPGVEFSVGGERPIHILVIFEASTDANHIDNAINHVFGASDRFDPNSGVPLSTGRSVLGFLDRLYAYCQPQNGQRRMKFLVIPAHADSGKGLANELLGATFNLGDATSLWDEMKGHLREQIISRRDWHGFQTNRQFEDLPPAFQDLLCRWIAQRRFDDWDTLTDIQKDQIRSGKHWPLIQCSDPHNYKTVGRKFTWMKMAVPDVEGIRLALLDPQSRLRRMEEGPPSCSYPRIERLIVQRTDFYNEASIPFNQCLTTLIGGRGSGKSTILEYLRYVLDRARYEDLPGDSSTTSRSAVVSVLSEKANRDFGDTKGTLLPDHTISVDLVVADKHYRISRNAHGFTVALETNGDSHQIVLLDPRSLIAPRILSQRQIAEIARNPTAQRAELDALIDPAELSAIDDERKKLTVELERLQNVRTRLTEKSHAIPTVVTNLRTVSDQIDFLKSEGREVVLADYETFERQRNWLVQQRTSLENVASSIEEEAMSIEEEEKESKAPKSTASTESWLVRVADRIGSTFKATAVALREQAGLLRDLEKEIANEQSTSWQSGYDKTRSAYVALVEEMSSRNIELAQHERLLQRKAQLEREVDSLQSIDKEIESIEAKVLETQRRLANCHDERANIRKQLAQVLDERDADVRLEIRPFADRSDFEDRRDQWFGGSGLREQDWNVLCDYVFGQDGNVPDRIVALSRAMRKDIELAGTESNLQQSNSNLAHLLTGEGRLTRTIFTALTRKDRVHIEEMERFLPEDLVLAKVRSPDGSFKSIEAGSVGEKSTAILSLLLSAGDHPIVIDQPEDDLDNRYVYNVVVDLLRRQKFSRQVIIATHNANIPVNGDAELIVALATENRLGTVRESGSIDKIQMKQLVSEIMEGSEEAFRLRRERYGY